MRRKGMSEFVRRHRKGNQEKFSQIVVISPTLFLLIISGLGRVNECCRVFVNSYTILKGFETHAARRVEEIIEKAHQVYM